MSDINAEPDVVQERGGIGPAPAHDQRALPYLRGEPGQQQAEFGRGHHWRVIVEPQRAVAISLGLLVRADKLFARHHAHGREHMHIGHPLRP